MNEVIKPSGPTPERDELRKRRETLRKEYGEVLRGILEGLRDEGNPETIRLNEIGKELEEIEKELAEK